MDSTIQQLQRDLASVLQGLDGARTQLQPTSYAGTAGKWSIQQIVEHLLLTYASTESVLKARIAKRTPTLARPSLAQHVAQYTILRLGYFPTGRKAPPQVMPAAVLQPLSGEELVLAASQHLAGMDQCCTQAGELFGESKRCASHLRLGPLSIQQWRRFHVVHGEHHLKQIVAIRRAHKV